MLLENKKALFDYEVLDTYEAGIALHGWEVASLRRKKASIKAGWISFKPDGAWLKNTTIAPYQIAKSDIDQNRDRKLLLKKFELDKISTKIKEQGCTLILIGFFSGKRYIKCKIALAKGRKKYDKKQLLKDRDIKRDMEKTLKNNIQGLFIQKN